MISLHMLVKNEVSLIARVVAHIRPYVDQVVITDTGSTDGTYELAKRIADVAHYIPLNMNFAQARNGGLGLCNQPWVLQVDADEWPTGELLCWIVQWHKTADVDALMIRRENLIDGKEIGERTYEWHPRLFRRHLRYRGALHESISPRNVEYAPEDLLLLHHKSEARQQRQNEFYRQWR